MDIHAHLILFFSIQIHTKKEKNLIQVQFQSFPIVTGWDRTYSLILPPYDPPFFVCHLNKISDTAGALMSAVFDHNGTKSDVGEHATLCHLRTPISNHSQRIIL